MIPNNKVLKHHACKIIKSNKNLKNPWEVYTTHVDSNINCFKIVILDMFSSWSILSPSPPPSQYIIESHFYIFIIPKNSNGDEATKGSKPLEFGFKRRPWK